MGAPKISDNDFVAAWKRCGSSPSLVAKHLDISTRGIMARRARLAERGIILPTVSAHPSGIAAKASGWQVSAPAYTQRVNETIQDGYLLVFSDAHFWPGVRSLAYDALLILAKRLQPKVIIGNGDILDGASISRHDPLGWQKLPTVIEELEEVKLRLDEIKRAAPEARHLLTAGNHDTRFDRRLATETPEFQDIEGFRLTDHLKGWPMSYSVLINEGVDPVFVLHNIRGGAHAPFNNVKAAGCTVITGHLHSQKVMPVTTLLHDWEGIDAGCLADREGPQFSYRMDRPADWRSGFCVMKFDEDGHHFPAELCRIQVKKNYSRAIFRGEVVVERRESLSA